MRSRRLRGLFLALLLAGLQPWFLTRLWDQVRELVPLLAASESPPPPAVESPSEGNPDLGLEMDPDG